MAAAMSAAVSGAQKQLEDMCATISMMCRVNGDLRAPVTRVMRDLLRDMTSGNPSSVTRARRALQETKVELQKASLRDRDMHEQQQQQQQRARGARHASAGRLPPRAISANSNTATVAQQQQQQQQRRGGAAAAAASSSSAAAQPAAAAAPAPTRMARFHEQPTAAIAVYEEQDAEWQEGDMPASMAAAHAGGKPRSNTYASVGELTADRQFVYSVAQMPMPMADGSVLMAGVNSASTGATSGLLTPTGGAGARVSVNSGSRPAFMAALGSMFGPSEEELRAKADRQAAYARELEEQMKARALQKQEQIASLNARQRRLLRAELATVYAHEASAASKATLSPSPTMHSADPRAPDANSVFRYSRLAAAYDDGSGGGGGGMSHDAPSGSSLPAIQQRGAGPRQPSAQGNARMRRNASRPIL